MPSAGFWEGTPSHPTGGFEYELARDLASRFGLGSVRIKIVHFHRIVSGQLGGADLALDLITPTESRESVLEFSTAYLSSPPTVVVRSGTEVPDLAAAQELRWGAVRATTFVEAIESSIGPQAPVRIYDGQRELMAALRAGKVDAVMFDLPLAVAIADQSNGRLEAVAQLPSSERISAVQGSAQAASALGSSGEAVAAASPAAVAILIGEAERLGEVSLLSGEGSNPDGASSGASRLAAELASRLAGRRLEPSAGDGAAVESLRPGQLCIMPVASWQLLAKPPEPPPGAAVMIVPEPAVSLEIA